jgi:hypothetical protein
MKDQGKTCAHEGCTCRVEATGMAGSGEYCSAECASGEGCDHSGCACGTRSRVQETEQSTSAD